MNLSSLDLNLLIVFDAIMRERHVTRAGDRIGLSQPAVSNALSRLRHHLKDDLFVRSPDGMRPTARATELAGPISAALQQLEAALDPPMFDPATSTREFRILGTDYVSAVILPRIINYLSDNAPNIDIRLLPLTDRTLEMLDQQHADFAITIYPDLPERFEALTLIDDVYVVLMRKGHPLAKGAITYKRFAQFPHMLVSLTGDSHGFVDDGLEAEGFSRRVALTIGQFSAAPNLLAESDMVLTVPKQLAETYAPRYDLELRPAPIAGPPKYSRASLIWHSKLATHPAHDWFREMLAAIFNT